MLPSSPGQSKNVALVVVLTTTLCAGKIQVDTRHPSGMTAAMPVELEPIGAVIPRETGHHPRQTGSIYRLNAARIAALSLPNPCVGGQPKSTWARVSQ